MTQDLPDYFLQSDSPIRRVTMPQPDRSQINTDKPETRCAICGGKCRIGYDPIYKRGARVIHCNSGFPKSGHCSWTSYNPGRIDPSWYWKLRVRLGI